MRILVGVIERRWGIYRYVFLPCLAIACLGFGLSSYAGPGPIATEPLLTSGSDTPNGMFLLDTSGSMSNIVTEEPFDPSVTYFSCPSSITVSTTRTVDIRAVQATGAAYFRHRTFNDWGTTPGATGLTGRTVRCFNPTATYSARLLGQGLIFSSISGFAYRPLNYLPTSYSGNYLNWYFGEGTRPWGAETRHKPGTRTRMQSMQTAMGAILNGLSDMRVGMAYFDPSSSLSTSRAIIGIGIDDIENNRSAMISAINALVADGGTPLATSLQSLVRYFIGNINNTLTLHPDTVPETKPALTVFNIEPGYATGVSSNSPIRSFCQKHNIITLTDGVPSVDNQIPTTTGLTDYDGDCATGGCLTFDRKPAVSYGVGGSDYMDDVAQAMFEMDLRPDIKDGSGNDVKTNITTYVIAFSDPNAQASPLMLEAGSQGGGQLFRPRETGELVEAFTNITRSIFSANNTSSNINFSGSSAAGNEAVYSGSYTGAIWSGDIIKRNINTDGSVGTQQWSAASILDNADFNNLLFFTYNRDTSTPVLFNDIANLSADQQADLNTAPTGLPDGRGQQRANYLRGDKSLETLSATNPMPFRARTSRQADIVNGGPLFIGIPQSSWPDAAPFPTASGNKYSDFQTANQNRTPAIYYGDNGAFIRGVNANTGANILNYITSNLFTSTPNQGLHYLTDPAYQHRFYNDLTPVAQDMYVQGAAGGGAAWRTVGAFGQRGGGRGYAFLDLTNPANFSPGNISSMFLAEFTHLDDPDLGFAFSEPTMGLMNNGRWAIILGNGFNNTGDGTAKIFVLFLNGGLDGKWKARRDYRELSTGIGELDDLNGMSAITAVDTDSNGTIDRIYGVDIKGNLFVFDVSSSNATQWRSRRQGSIAQPLFSSGETQPITTRPIVVRNPGVATTDDNFPNLLVMFGTGQFINSDDKLTTTTQAFYGIWDSGKHNLDTSDLLQQTFTVNNTNRVLTDNAIDYTNPRPNRRDYGWYINLDSAERVLFPASIRAGNVIFSTFIPNTNSVCSTGGSGFVMAAKIVNGGQPDDTIFDINNDDQLNDVDDLSGEVVSGIKYVDSAPFQPTIRNDRLYLPTSETGTINDLKILSNDKLLGRISWKQINTGN